MLPISWQPRETNFISAAETQKRPTVLEWKSAIFQLGSRIAAIALKIFLFLSRLVEAFLNRTFSYFPNRSDLAEMFVETQHSLRLWSGGSVYKMDEGGQIYMPGDGNCAYHSASTLLKCLGIEVTHEDVRREVYKFIKAHKEDDPTLSAYLISSHANYNENRYCESEELSSVDAYVESIQTSGFWADIAELYAFEKIYNVRVKVEGGPNGDVFFSEEDSARAVVRFVYTGAHYNCRILSSFC